MSGGVLLPLLSLLLACSSSWGNQMDPHRYPKRGPFFEGWYLRIIDHPQKVSIGFLFGRVLPQASEKLGENNATSDDGPNLIFKSENLRKDKPLVVATLLVSLADGTQLESPTGFFCPDRYSITENGKPVRRNPNDLRPPTFEAQIGSNVSFTVNPKTAKFDFKIGDHEFEGSTSSPVPWGPLGAGPEGWLEFLPLPLHWFIYSLRSDVDWYRYKNRKTGVEVSGPSKPHTAIAHLEKNWGRAFPPAWVWAEGADPVTGVSFSFSSGLLDELGAKIPVQLSGYRNPQKKISCNFSPIDSFHKLEHDACAGIARLSVSSLFCKVTFVVKAPVATFSECLQTPQYDGFSLGCKESYSAVANITVYEPFANNLQQTDNQVIEMAALEFGEDYVCNKECTRAKFF